LGRLTTEKGFDVFIEYAVKYKNNFNFIAAGDFASTDDSDVLRKDAINCGIVLKGFIPIDELFSEVDVLLLPTKWNEPFGRVVAEAAVSGIQCSPT
jgi:glycosyltransferase involved in cell wall biosynthesis